jgi:hypothetical protein
MRTAHARVIGIAVGNLPPCRHGQRLSAIWNIGVIVDFVTMKGYVDTGAVTLMGGGVERVVAALTKGAYESINFLKQSVRCNSATVAAFFRLGARVECEVGDIAHLHPWELLLLLYAP